MRSPLRRALAVPLCLAVLVSASCTDSAAPTEPTVQARIPDGVARTIINPPSASNDVGYYINESQALPYCPWPWNGCRELDPIEKQLAIGIANVLLQSGASFCQDIGLKMYSMILGEPSTIRVGFGTPVDPQGYYWYGTTTTAFKNGIALESISVVSDFHVMSGFPGEKSYVFVHEAIHQYYHQLGQAGPPDGGTTDQIALQCMAG